MITIHAATASESLNKDSEAQTHRAAVVTRLSERSPLTLRHEGTVMETTAWRWKQTFIFHYRISVHGHCPSSLSVV